MASRRERDFRRYHRQYESKTAWPYPTSRPTFQFQRNQWAGGDDNSSLETKLIDSPVNIHNCHVDFELVSSSSEICHKKYWGKAPVIVFKPDEIEPSSQFVQSHSAKCSPVTSSSSLVMKLNGATNTEHCCEEDPEGPPVPKVSLFPENKIVLGWREVLPVGAGMCNLGNTCYINSTLQALFHIPSFCHWLSNEGDHDICENDYGEKCIICAMFYTLRNAQSKSGNVIKPSLIYSRLKSICRHMCQGRQEDAHEFFRYLLEKMENSYLDRFKGKQLDNASKETTPLHRIFGGYMRTEISCGVCKGASTTFQHFQDLLLDIRRSSSLENALRVFFSSESLEGDDGGGEGDAYRCTKCQRKGFCVKRNYIQVPPKVLCIQLKRFTALGGKLVKAVTYPEKLDIAPYVYSKSNAPQNSSPTCQRRLPLMYQLTSVVSHCGGSMNSGHYTATAKSSNGAYFEFDDSMVHQVSVHSALAMSAYILMYEMLPSSSEPFQNYTSHKSAFLGSEKAFAIPPNRPKLMFGSSSRLVNGVTSSLSSTALPPMKERAKVYFGIKPGNLVSANGASPVSNGVAHGYSESNGTSLKSLSSDSCASPKVNGVSVSKTNRNWGSSSSGRLFPFSMTECNKVSKSGPAMRMEGVVVGRRTVDHLVPYPVSGDSSDEEEERRRRRKASENGVMKCPAASEMTISGNLTPDATALATKRGWTVAEGKREECVRDKVEVSISSVSRRREEEDEASSSSPCSSTSSQLSDSHNATSIKSILKIFDGSGCKLMESKEQNPSKCSVLGNGAGSIVKGVSKRKSWSLSNVVEWLNGIEPEGRESGSIERFPLASTPIKSFVKRPSFHVSASMKSLKDESRSKGAAAFEDLLQFPCQSGDGVFSISKSGWRVPYSLNELYFADDQTSSESDANAGSDPLMSVNEPEDESCNFSWSSSSP